MLYLYKDFTPNQNGVFHYYTSLSTFMTAIASSLETSITETNYRINSEVCKVLIDTTFTEAKAERVTYIIDSQTSYHRNYHVKKCVFQSGYVIYFLDLDLWGTYIDKAGITNLNVLKCSRNVGKGIYDEPIATDAQTLVYPHIDGVTSTQGTLPLDRLFDVAKACIVFAVKYVTYSQGDANVSTTMLCKMNLKTLKEYVTNLGVTLTEKSKRSWNNAVDLALEVVGGIFGVEATNGYGISTTNAAEVLGAWICEDTYIISGGGLTIGIKTKNNYTGEITIPSSVAVEVVPYRLSRSITIDIFDPNYVYYFGTAQTGVKLQRLTSANSAVQIQYITENTGLKVIASQGDNQQDITSAFAVDVTLVNGDVSAQRLMLHALKTSAQTAVSVWGIMTGKDAFKVAGTLGLMKTGIDLIDPKFERSQGKLIDAGDGVTNWRYWISGSTLVEADYAENNSVPVLNPYVITKCATIDDEKKQALYKGANFNVWLSGLADVFTPTFLNTSVTLDYTFVQANANVDAIPSDASAFIQAKLQEGIYLKRYV